MSVQVCHGRGGGWWLLAGGLWLGLAVALRAAPPLLQLQEPTATGTAPALPTAPALLTPSTPPLGANAPTPTERELDRAFNALAQGQIAEALQLFERLLAREPLNRRARMGKGTALIQQERYREALALLEPMLREFPDDYALKNNLAWLYATAKDRHIRSGRRAVALAQEALLLTPNDCHVWSTLAEGYFLLAQYDKALRAAEQALALGQQTEGANAELLAEYARMVERSRQAAAAMTLIPTDP